MRTQTCLTRKDKTEFKGGLIYAEDTYDTD